MAHPFATSRQNKVERSRVSHITRGYATGGAVGTGETPKEKKIARKVYAVRDAQAVQGGSVKERMDRPGRARGGRAPKNKGNTVNVIVAPQGAHASQPPALPPAGLAAPGVAPPPMPPRPLSPGAPGMAGPPPGAALPPPGMVPPGMPPRSHGGRTYKTGGAVKKRADGGVVQRVKRAIASDTLAHKMGTDKSWDPLYDKPSAEKVRQDMREGMESAQNVSDSVPRRAKGGRVKSDAGVASGRAWEEGKRNGTQMQNNPSGKNDQGDVNRPRPITYKTGGAIYSASKGQMGPKFDGGAGGGTARLEKESRAARKYARA